VQSKRKKDAVFMVGFIIGMTWGIVLHHLGLGAAFGVILGLALRETYERKTNRF
jgi:hypothetical protein